MYIVCRSNDEEYGNVIAILHAEEGEQSPFFAVEEAKKQKRLWQQEESIKVRFIIDNQILTPLGLDRWARSEYDSLPKCGDCHKLLHGEVHNNAMSDGILFCSISCAARDHERQVEYQNDYEEFYL
jgi:hypothetical protein